MAVVRIAALGDNGFYKIRPAQALLGPNDQIRFLNLTGVDLTLVVAGLRIPFAACERKPDVPAGDVIRVAPPYCGVEPHRFWRIPYDVLITPGGSSITPSGSSSSVHALKIRGESSPEIIIDEQP